MQSVMFDIELYLDRKVTKVSVESTLELVDGEALIEVIEVLNGKKQVELSLDQLDYLENKTYEVWAETN